MLFLLGYVYIAIYQLYQRRRRKAMLRRIVTDNIKYGSIILRKVPVAANIARDIRLVSELIDDNELWSAGNVQLWETGHQVLTVSPQISVNLKKWTSYLDQQDFLVQQSLNTPDKCYVLLEMCQLDDTSDIMASTLSIPRHQITRIVDYATPIAWKPGIPFGIVAECSQESLVELAIAFIRNTLVLDDMLELRQMISVNLIGHAFNLLKLDREIESDSPLPEPGTSDSETVHKSWDNIIGSIQCSVAEEQGFYDGSNESLASSTPNLEDVEEGTGPSEPSLLDGETMADFGESSSQCEGQGQEAGGEAMSPSVEELAPELLTPARRRQINQCKPPNMVIYTGKKDSARQFENVSKIIKQCVDTDKYTIYPLKHDQVHTTPWIDNTVLLIISSDKTYDNVAKVFYRYFQAGGSIISFSSPLDELFVEKIQTSSSPSILSLDYKYWVDVTVICGRHVYAKREINVPDVSMATVAVAKQTGQPVILEAYHESSGGVAILSQVNLEKDPVEMAISPETFALLKKSNPSRFEILIDLMKRLGIDCRKNETLKLTPCVLYSTTREKGEAFWKSLEARLIGGQLKSKQVTLHFMPDSGNLPADISADLIPVVTDLQAAKGHYKFNFDIYKQHLKTNVLGNLLLYADVVHSTMNLFEGLMYSVPPDVGLIAIASRQTSGKGRGGNAWLSPVGCAMFSLHIRIPLNSKLGKRAAYLQHITSLAVVEAVRTIPGYQDIDIRLKWPNDIYFGSNMKLGGVLVNSSILHDVIHANVGCGFNVSNKDPTVCINDLIEQQNYACAASLKVFTTEELIARTLSRLEELMDLFQTQGKDAFLELYYKRWLHSDAIVRLEKEDGVEAKMIGLDDYGFLSVQLQDGSTVTVHPDGNSFDLLRNLIIPKT